MTSLIAWIGVDSRAPSSIYLASDSRISWGSDGNWDYGRKLFASKKHPDILGYCGDVLFPSQVLGQVIDMIDSDALFASATLSAQKWAIIASVIMQSFTYYPAKKARQFTIVYCTRENSGMESIFRIYTLAWQSQNKWIANDNLRLPQESAIIDLFGSGESNVSKWLGYWNKTRQKRTSRAIFSAFCDALASAGDQHSGGAPQLVGVYRKEAAKSFGVIYRGEAYLCGMLANELRNHDAIEWRNELFERCSGKTRQALENAQRHSRPRGLGKSIADGK